MRKVMALLNAMRPLHWTKNCFVLAPLVFSGQFNQPISCFKTAIMFIAFCVASSAIYIINDIFDREEDQQHPTKKFRPIASGVINIGIALLMSVILILLSLALAWYLGFYTFLVIVIFIILNFIYSMALKHVAILDVMLISIGFVLRIIGGGVAISVAPSHWLILCTIMISMFLAFTKRRAELSGITDHDKLSRKVLKDYSISFLDQAISIITGATIICYALYTVDKRTYEVFGSNAMLLTIPCVIYGLLRYIYLIYHLKSGQDPTDTLIRDIPTIINMIIWILLSLSIILFKEKFGLFLG